MNFIKNLFLLSILFGCFTISSQEKETLKVHSFEEVEKLQLQNPKPIVVFIYTDWCKICFGMKKKTFRNDKTISLLNSDFYFIMLNGEEKKDISFLGKTFKFKPSGNKTGIHQLAKELASIKNKINYPTTTILNSKYEIDVQLDSYITSKKMEKLLNEYLNK